jgi:hypothetical protein
MNQRLDSARFPAFHAIELFVLHPVAYRELVRLYPAQRGFIEGYYAAVLS